GGGRLGVEPQLVRSPAPFASPLQESNPAARVVKDELKGHKELSAKSPRRVRIAQCPVLSHDKECRRGGEAAPADVEPIELADTGAAGRVVAALARHLDTEFLHPLDKLGRQLDVSRVADREWPEFKRRPLAKGV